MQVMHACMLSCFSHVHHFAILWSPASSSVHGILQARILKWVAMPSCRDLPGPGIKPSSCMSPALTGGFFTTSAIWESPDKVIMCYNCTLTVEFIPKYCTFFVVQCNIIFPKLCFKNSLLIYKLQILIDSIISTWLYSIN